MQTKSNCENLKFSGTNGSRDIWGNIWHRAYFLYNRNSDMGHFLP